MKEGQRFTMWAGESKAVTINVTDATTGSAVTLTNASVVWVLATGLGESTLLTKDSDWTGACGITVSGCSFSFVLTHADTDALRGEYYHEAEIKDSAGCTFKPCRGYIEVEQGQI